MNLINAFSNRFPHRCVNPMLWLGLAVVALVMASGCGGPSAELQELDAKALAAATPQPMSPEQRMASARAGAPEGQRIPHGAPSTPAVSSPPSRVVVAAAPVVVAPPAEAPVVAPRPEAAKPVSAKSNVMMVTASPAGAPPKRVPGTPALKAQLKTIWTRGADAKHNNDAAGARRIWSSARRIAPQWPGFQESINKLKP